MAMKDTFDVITDVRSLLNVPAVTDLVTGKIWADSRPNNSGKIDLVVNCNAITNTATQIGYGNVNGYVPSLSVPDGKGGMQQSPDYAKMSSLCKAISPFIDTQFRETFHTEVEDAGKVFQDTDGSWFFNISFKYYSIQDNYQNI
jgi:hypothetical protein